MAPTMNCIHQATGLCQTCQEEFEADPVSWYEYGDHTQGIRNWEALQKEMANRQDVAPAGSFDDLPF